MNELMEFQSYDQFKAAFDVEARNQAENFIRMGYLLKVARDTNILYESGYKSISEFALQEYGIPGDAVSRMISANDRYSENGYSPKLTDRYSGYGKSLLSEMLTLSDEVVAALPDGITRQEIRDIKAEIKEEQKITDLEVLMEEPMQQDLESNLAKVLYQFYKENCREYPKLHEIIRNGLTLKTAMEHLAPSGIGVKMVRVPGIGKLMLSIKGPESHLELVNIRTNETEEYTWTQCIMVLAGICGGSEDYRDDWMRCYGTPFPGENEPQPQSGIGFEELKEKPDKGAIKTAETEKKIKPVVKHHEETSKEPETAHPEEKQYVLEQDVKETVPEPIIKEPAAGTQRTIQEFIGIMPEPEYAEEQRQWEAARDNAEKIYLDLKKYDFSTTKEFSLILESAEASVRQLLDTLQAIKMGDAWEKVS